MEQTIVSWPPAGEDLANFRVIMFRNIKTTGTSPGTITNKQIDGRTDGQLTTAINRALQSIAQYKLACFRTLSVPVYGDAHGC